MNEFEKNGFATFIDNGNGWERIPNAKFMMRDEDGTEIEMTPREVINQLYQDNKTLEHYIYNLQSKIDKAIEYIENNIWEDEYGGDVIEDYNHELLKILKEDK